MSGGTLYGTTRYGGSSGSGTVFRLNTNGTGFTVLKNLDLDTGALPRAGLVQSGNALYGTAYQGGNSERGYQHGTVFWLGTNGAGSTVLREFTNSDGSHPFAGLVLSSNTLYGTTVNGGVLGSGTVFKLELSSRIFLVRQSPGNAVVLSWSSPGFTLQAAPAVTGTFTNIPGATSPYTNALSGPQRFFRLLK